MADFRELALAELELFETRQQEIREFLAQSEILEGFVLVSTCNRFELYFESEDHDQVQSLIETELESLSHHPVSFSSKFQLTESTDIAEHLFSVASGLRSMIIGESEIAGQVKRSFKIAQDNNQSSKNLSRLFQHAMKTSKQVATTTEISKVGKSIIDVALNEAKFEDVSSIKALIIGTGAYARVVAASLKRRGVENLSVYSRSGRAKTFAESHDVKPVETGELLKTLEQSDLVISASGKPGFSITLEDFKNLTKTPKTVIDMALSQDVDPEIENLGTSQVIRLSTLTAQPDQKADEVRQQADQIVRDAVLAFNSVDRQSAADPVITNFHSVMEQRIAAQLGKQLSSESDQELEMLVRKTVRAILHTPTMQAKKHFENGQQAEFEQALNMVFALDEQAKQ